MSLVIIFTGITNLSSGQGFTFEQANGDMTLVDKGWIKEISENEIFMFNIEKDILYIIAPNNESYTEGSMQDYCDAMKTMMETMKQSIPAEYLDEMITTQNNLPIPDVKVKNTGNGREIAGYNTDRYEIIVNGELYEEKWISTDASFSKLITFYSHVYKTWELMDECSVLDEAFIGKDAESTKAYIELENKGIELKAVSHEYGYGETTKEVMDVQKGSIDASEFSPPDGFRKLTFSEFIADQMEEE